MTLALPTDSGVAACALDAQDNLTVGGSYLAMDGTLNFAAGRFTNSGQFDPTFNMGVPQTIPLGKGFSGTGTPRLHSLFVVDGKIVLVGVSPGPNDNAMGTLTVVRLNGDGSLDASFGSNGVSNFPYGKLVMGLGPYGAIDKHRRVVLAGNSDSAPYIARVWL
jgi:hypothetical protein